MHDLRIRARVGQARDVEREQAAGGGVGGRVGGVPRHAAAALRDAILDRLPALYGETARAPDALHTRASGVDPFTQGSIAQWAPGDVCAVGPLHGTHGPPFCVAGSDHWVAGSMEGAVRTGRAAAAAALSVGARAR